MKQKVLPTVFLIAVTLLAVSCTPTPSASFSLSEMSWCNKNDDGDHWYYEYTITAAPEKYAEFINTKVFYSINPNQYCLDWEKDCKESIRKALENEEFQLVVLNDRKILCTNINFNNSPYRHSKKTSFKTEKKTIYAILSSKYAGFPDMKGKGFSRKIWNNAASYEEMAEILDACVNDTHLSISTPGGFWYKQKQRFDEGTVPSTDPEKTFRVLETSNTFYIRCNSCDITWEEYLQLPSLAVDAQNKENIILDFRSNHGGGNGEQHDFLKALALAEYAGTIYVLQDNWSYSSGEVWGVAGNCTDYLNLKLVGTHSGGAQIYGNCQDIVKNGVKIWTPTSSFKDTIPANYLGEGLGYEPDIWATTADMKEVLEGLGLDVTGVTFR